MNQSLKYIDIDKSSVPYEFDIQIAGTTYKFNINYNMQHDFFTVDLYLKSTGAALVFGEKVVYGRLLFGAYVDFINNRFSIVTRTPNHPKAMIFARDLSDNEKRVTFDNMGNSVLLYVVTEDEFNGQI